VPEQKTATFRESENFAAQLMLVHLPDCAAFARHLPGFVESATCKPNNFIYIQCGFGRVENRSRREPGEESPNTKGRDAA